MKFISLFLISLCSFGSLFACIRHYETPIVKYLKPIEITEFESGFPGVNCIYVINLDERPEKWQRMKALLDERGLKANRVSAINGWKLPAQVIKELVGPYEIRMSPGAFGCLLSHVSAIKDAYDRGFDLIWIMEDDVAFIEDFSQISSILKQLSEIDKDWDAFFTDTESRNNQGVYVPSVGSNFRPDQKHPPHSYFLKKTRINHDIMKIHQRFGMYSFFLTKKGIKKVLDYFTHVHLWSDFDVDFHYVPNLREYSATRDIVSIWFECLITDTRFEPKPTN
jgi:GR25 family glycosyltransferase involved in LPS biosynthesis